MGLFMPSSNNAALDLLPDRVGVIAGLRQFFRQVGGMIGTAGIVVALSLSPDKAAGMREIYTVLALLLIVTIPLAFLIPDAARERRLGKGSGLKDVEPRSARAATVQTAATTAARSRRRLGPPVAAPKPKPRWNAQAGHAGVPSPASRGVHRTPDLRSHGALTPPPREGPHPPAPLCLPWSLSAAPPLHGPVRGRGEQAIRSPRPRTGPWRGGAAERLHGRQRGAGGEGVPGAGVRAVVNTTPGGFHSGFGLSLNHATAACGRLTTWRSSKQPRLQQPPLAGAEQCRRWRTATG